MNDPHRYFVAYAHQRGFGNCEIVRVDPITSHDDITEIGEAIARKNGYPQPAIVISFQPLAGAGVR